jgi:uncharacterized membrane protein YfcA
MLIELFLISILIGITIGIIGGGGAILFIPALMYYNLSFQQAVAISLFLNSIPNALPGLYFYYKKGYFDFKIASIVACGSILGIIIGAYILTNDYIDIKILYRIYTFLLLLTTLYMFYYYC